MLSSHSLDMFTITINPDHTPSQLYDESNRTVSLRVVSALMNINVFEFWNVVCFDPYYRDQELVGVAVVKSLFRGTANVNSFAAKRDYIIITEDNIDIFEKVCRAVSDVGLVQSKKKIGPSWDVNGCKEDYDRAYARKFLSYPADLFIPEMFTLLSTHIPPGTDFVQRLHKNEKQAFEKLLDYFNINVDNEYVAPKLDELKQLKAAISAAIVVGNW